MFILCSNDSVLSTQRSRVWAAGGGVGVRGVTETFTPALQLHETAGRCRLSLAGVTYGNGRTLQEAGDDLVARLLDIALGIRASSFAFAGHPRTMDRRVLDFIWEVGEMSAR